MYLKKINIGNVEIENNVFLGPMAGITDRPFRLIAKEFGAGLVTTEMVSSKALLHGDKKTEKLLNRKEEKSPLSAQIFGSDVESMIVGGKHVAQHFEIVDINMGCPAPKVVKNGDGSKLLLDLELIEKIVKEVVNAIDKPVTVKIRTGWDADNIVAKEVAQVVEEAGAKMITVHGRTRAQYYSGKVNLDLIKKVKECVNIPVIGNGDIVDEETAVKMFEYTGVDGIMIARGSLGNPWIFKEVLQYLRNKEKMEPPTLEEKLNIILKHIELEVEEKGEIVAIREMRKHIAWYIKGLKEASKARVLFNQIETREELETNLKEYFKQL